MPVKKINNNSEKTATGCRPSQLFGLWAIEPERMAQYVQRAEQCDLAALARDHAERVEAELIGEIEANTAALANLPNGEPGAAPPKPYAVRDGVAIFQVNGPTTKYPTSFQEMFGGTATVPLQRALRLAKADPDVYAGFMHFEDAPGGTVAGAYELRDDIVAFAKAKPLRAHVTDLAASAAQLFAAAAASQWTRLTANQIAHVGSIGVRTHVDDLSKAFEMKGIKRIPIAKGKFKAAGLPGTVVTDEMVAEAQNRIDKLNELFVNAISQDRKLPPDKVAGFEARVFLAEDAVANGLLDGVCDAEQAFAEAKELAAAERAKQERAGQLPANSGVFGMNLIDQLKASLSLPATATEADVINAVNQQKSQAGTLAGQVQTLTTERDAARAAMPKVDPPDVLASRLSLAGDQINLSVERGKLSAPAAAKLKTACGIAADANASKPSAFMLTPVADLGGKRPVEWMLDTFAEQPGNNPKPGSKTTPQDQIRQVPGGRTNAATDEGDEAMSDEDAAMEEGRRHGQAIRDKELARHGGGNGVAAK